MSKTTRVGAPTGIPRPTEYEEVTQDKNFVLDARRQRDAPVLLHPRRMEPINKDGRASVVITSGKKM